MGNCIVNIECSSFIVKAFVCSVSSGNLRLYVERTQQSQVHKNMSWFYKKNIKILVTLLLELKTFELVCLYNFDDNGKFFKNSKENISVGVLLIKKFE